MRLPIAALSLVAVLSLPSACGPTGPASTAATSSGATSSSSGGAPHGDAGAGAPCAVDGDCCGNACSTEHVCASPCAPPSAP